MEDAFKIRERSLEEAFFAKRNREQIAALKEKRVHEVQRAELAQNTGIKNEAVLDELVDLEIDVSTVSALALAPLVSVAWMDLTLTEIERHDIIKAAADFGIEDNGPAYELLKSWLDEAPPEDLMGVWSDYAKALVEAKGVDKVASIKEEVYSKTKNIAEKAGGFFGIGSGLTSSGEKILKQIEDAFRG